VVLFYTLFFLLLEIVGLLIVIDTFSIHLSHWCEILSLNSHYFILVKKTIDHFIIENLCKFKRKIHFYHMVMT